jgi:hypothetical protein
MVRLCLTASRFNCAMTESSIFNVVFIWETISKSCQYGKNGQQGGDIKPLV